jgi:hypothetical protein
MWPGRVSTHSIVHFTSGQIVRAAEDTPQLSAQVTSPLRAASPYARSIRVSKKHPVYAEGSVGRACVLTSMPDSQQPYPVRRSQKVMAVRLQKCVAQMWKDGVRRGSAWMRVIPADHRLHPTRCVARRLVPDLHKLFTSKLGVLSVCWVYC